MKTNKRIFIILLCTVILFSNIFMCFSMPVFAKPTLDENGHLHVYNWDDIKDCAVDWVMYMASLAGAIFADRDFAKYVQNKDAWVDHWTEDNVIIGEGGTSVTFSKELMAFIKQCIDEYAKTEQTKEENGGFYLLPTIKYTEVPAENFKTMWQYRTFQNIVLEKGLLAVKIGSIQFTDPFSDPEHPILLVADASSLNEFKANPERRLAFNFFCAYDWEYEKQTIMWFENAETQLYTSCEQAVQFNTGNIGYSSGAGINSETLSYLNYDLYSTTGERMRVFVSKSAAQNYSVGKRKVYFTNNYYNYVPEDLTVSIDDLQKSVSDLQKIIDELLKRISDNSREKEIEELLRQILEELRNQQSAGGGGSGGGDVTVNVDMKETNSWLSKIFSKVSQIFDKMDSSVEDAENAAISKIQESLDEIIIQLKKIKGWTIADTMIDAADAVADWLDLIKDFLTDADSGVAAISSSMDGAAGLLKTKFPFCIPWDVYFLISFLAHEPEAPVFRLPLKIERLGIEEYIEVDLTQFAVVSDISRTLLTLIYCYALLNLTMKIFPMTKEET